jgi:hypothetical protein
MNWKQGLFRVWIAASVCWVLVLGVQAAMNFPSGMVVRTEVAGSAKYYACVDAAKKKNLEDVYSCEMAGGAPHEVVSTVPYTAYGLVKFAAPWLFEMIVGPLAVLAAWFTAFWIIAGFKPAPDKSN